MASFRVIESVLLWHLTTFLVTASPASDAATACARLASQYPQQLAYNPFSLNVTLDNDYQTATTRYWSQANADNVPTCVFFPTLATHVASAVKVINTYSDVLWAVKGGGHNPNVGFSSTSGILIAMETMNGVSLDSNNLAHVGAGALWEDVQTALDPFGRGVVGGRIGDVGVGGYMLGGGLSFLSAQYGLAADSVMNFEVVTADGSIVNVNPTTNTDLFFALKGGGNQFAIVTTYTLQTFPVGRVWGGHRFYTIDKKDALINATHNLVSNYYDPKAAVIVTFSTTIFDLLNVFVVFYFYNDAAGPGPILSEFNAISPLLDFTSANRTFGGLLTDNSQFTLSGQRYLIRAETIPNLPGQTGVDLYQYAFNSWYAMAQPDQFKAIDNFIFNIAFQPLPHQIVDASLASPTGGDCLGLTKSGDHMWMEYDTSWLLRTSDALAAGLATNLTQPLDAYARSKYSGSEPTNYQTGDTTFTNFNPVFMNDAMFNQDPLHSYGAANYNRLAAIQKSRDPNGFFSQRTGGFKYT